GDLRRTEGGRSELKQGKGNEPQASMFTVGLIRQTAAAAIAAVPIFMFAQSASDVPVAARAKRLHDRAIVVDTHDDTPQRLLFDKTFDIGTRNKDGHVDIPRMREGGLDALFFSIWVPSHVTGPPAVKRALDLIDSVRQAVRTHPNDLMLANTAARRQSTKLQR